jgi:hypothetical protein
MGDALHRHNSDRPLAATRIIARSRGNLTIVTYAVPLRIAVTPTLTVVGRRRPARAVAPQRPETWLPTGRRPDVDLVAPRGAKVKMFD